MLKIIIYIWQHLKKVVLSLLKSKKINDLGMNTAFFEKSKQIANGYLQNIAFLDDKAFENNANIEQGHDNQHAFDSSAISKVFAKEKKICAVYRPVIETDIEDFKEISKKADVAILDWLITLQNTIEEDTLTEDAEEDDPRGQYTKQIIKELIECSGSDSLKLIVIYTGEDILEEITQNIFSEISEWNQNFEIDNSNCEVYSKNIKILVRGKSGGNNEIRFKQRPHLLDKILTYDELPSFVLKEFTIMTSGLLSNMALLSLSTIRNNSHKMLNLFSKDLDAAYMGHKALLPNQNDSEDLLLKLFGDTVTDLLHYSSIPQKIREELVDIWIDANIVDEEFTSTNNKKFQRTKDFLKQLMHSNNEDIEKRFDEVFNGTDLSKAEKKQYREFKSTELFLNLAHQDKKEMVNSGFAKLTHHKSLFLPQNTIPKLTLGTIIKSSVNENNYYVCIQQRCDSVRLKKDEERKFLFLPLSKVVDGKFHIITPEGDKLKLDKKSYLIKTIKFKCNCDEGEVKGILSEDRKYIFKEIYEGGETFEWVLDLKDLHSQRIVTNYVTELSRIGLDESEWLRMASN